MKNRLLEKTGIHDLENFDWIAYFENNKKHRKKLDLIHLDARPELTGP